MRSWRSRRHTFRCRLRPPTSPATATATSAAGTPSATSAWERLRKLQIGGERLSAIERQLGPPYPRPKDIALLGPGEVDRPLAWSELNVEQRAFQAGKMAVHAAMVDRMDREIGRIVDQLGTLGVLDDTLLLFLSDNGASAEIMVRGDGHDPHAECGTGATFLSLGPGWSSMANTPFRRHKTWVHEGGISTPLVAHWPRESRPAASCGTRRPT